LVDWFTKQQANQYPDEKAKEIITVEIAFYLFPA
jgi:hypothetical protein